MGGARPDGPWRRKLEEALRSEIGIMGGSGGPGQPSLACQGAGLKTWCWWESINLVQNTPIFTDRATVAMAREVYCPALGYLSETLAAFPGCPRPFVGPSLPLSAHLQSGVCAR
jgi:hypothetical protein